MRVVGVDRHTEESEERGLGRGGGRQEGGERRRKEWRAERMNRGERGVALRRGRGIETSRASTREETKWIERRRLHHINTGH